MNESARKVNQNPESYSPKDKPDIIHMAGQKTTKLVITDNGKYIDNIAPLQWSAWRECTYSGCMALLLDGLGVDTTYEQIMGLTGSCYRASMAYGWDPGSNIVSITYHCLFGSFDAEIPTQNVNRFYGIESRTIPTSDRSDRERLAIESIDAGIPVLVLGSRCFPEWGILLGYENTPDGVKFFGRSYFDKNAPEEERFTPNGYVLANRFPAESEGMKLYIQSCEPTPPVTALKCSLETCLEMFKPHDKFGYGAYDRMIESFEKGQFLTDWNNEGEIYTILITLTDARRAAYLYLEESAQLLTGENKQDLLAVSSLYRNMFLTLHSIIQEEDLDNEVLKKSEENRRKIANKLHKCLDLEHHAHDLIRGILENWKDSDDKIC